MKSLERILDWFLSIDPPLAIVILSQITVILALGLIGLLIWQ